MLYYKILKVLVLKVEERDVYLMIKFLFSVINCKVHTLKHDTVQL